MAEVWTGQETQTGGLLLRQLSVVFSEPIKSSVGKIFFEGPRDDSTSAMDQLYQSQLGLHR